MHQHVPQTTNPVRRATRLTGLAALLAGAVAGTGAVTAAPAVAHDAVRSSHGERHAHGVSAKLRHGRLTVRGTRRSDAIALRLEAGRPDVLQIDVGDDGSADFRVGRRFVDAIRVNARGGDDRLRIDESNGVFTDTIPTTLDGGAGDDRIAGGSGVETLLGGRGNDTIDGNKGNDLALLGAGDDTFVWDPGDGSDVVEGGAGGDTMRFNGAAASEHVDLTANGHRLRFFRDVGTITMDTDGVETVDFNALGGADTVTVGDLTGTDVTTIDANLAGSLGGTVGDGQPDTVTVNGSDRKDAITAAGSSGVARVAGLFTTVNVTGAEPADDTLRINALGGDDVVDASSLEASAIALAIDGGAGNDVLLGGSGNDRLFGGDGDDLLNGGPGVDALDGGAGNNVLIQG